MVNPYSEKEKKLIKTLWLNNLSLRELVIELNKQIHKGKSIRTYRSVETYINRHRDDLGLVKRHKMFLSDKYDNFLKVQKLNNEGKTAEQISNELGVGITSVKYNLQKVREVTNGLKTNILKEAEKIRLLETENRVLKTSLNSANAYGEILIDTVKRHIIPLKETRKIYTFTPKHNIKKPEIAMLEISDAHCGEKVDPSETADLSIYNFEIFEDRMKKLWEGIVECIEIQRSKIPIDTLDINMLGDIVTGENIYLGQSRQIDLYLTEQLFKASRVFESYLLLPALQFFKKVRVRCVWGNHGRVGKKGEYHPKTNFDYIFYRQMYERFRNEPRIEWYISESNLLLFQLPEAPSWTHLIVHGDEVKSWMSTPYYAIDRMHAKFVQLFGMNINYLHVAHFHNKCITDVPYGEKIVNGSFVGGSDFSVRKLQTSSQPKQLLYGFNERWGKTWSYDIKLADLKKLTPNSDGIFTPVMMKG